MLLVASIHFAYLSIDCKQAAKVKSQTEDVCYAKVLLKMTNLWRAAVFIFPSDSVLLSVTILNDSGARL